MPTNYCIAVTRTDRLVVCPACRSEVSAREPVLRFDVATRDEQEGGCEYGGAGCQRYPDWSLAPLVMEEE